MSRGKRRKLQGWRFGVTVSAWTAFTILLLNLILTIYAAARYHETLQDGIGTTHTGSCDRINTWATWLHVLINALSSILLSASNYTMQCLSAPTRKEIDRAHARGDYMDVGVASVRNLSRINWRRAALWSLLALSSIPIHLLYNSAIFKTLNANEYVAAVVNPDFLHGGEFYPNMTVHFPTQSLRTPFSPELGYVQQVFANNTNYLNTTLVRNMTNAECIGNYSTSFVNDRNHVLLVTNDPGNSSLPNQTAFWETQVKSAH